MGRSQKRSLLCVENENAVVLGLCALNPREWVVMDLLKFLEPVEAYCVLRLLSGLSFRPGQLSGLYTELAYHLGREKANMLVQTYSEKAVKFPSFGVILDRIQTARCYTYAKRHGEAKAANLLGIPKSLVHSRRTYVHRKVAGGA